jgi:hypothetical protein
MMKHYDKSAGVAVVEWRNALHQARNDQHLPLLYVANEVLQNSKRNRGNKFLEAFSPTLGQALIHVCQTNPAGVEKVRRTVKIWGDRHVFSVRFVNELLKGMDPYRNGSSQAPRRHSVSSSPPGKARFSPLTKPPVSPQGKKPLGKPTISPAKHSVSVSSTDKGDESDEGDLFGDASDRILNIELDLDKAAASVKSTKNKRKRGRGSDTLSSMSLPKAQRRRSMMNTNSLMNLWNQVSSLQDSYDHVQSMISTINSNYLDESSAMEQIDTLVGDELLQEYKQTMQYEKRVVDQRQELHNIAQKRRVLEMEAVRYLPWLEGALKQDQDDIEFSKKLEKQATLAKNVHALAKAARNARLEQEAILRQQEEELQQKKAEEEERKKFMETAMSKVTEAEPGMVWNKATGEYQYLRTDESWRD